MSEHVRPVHRSAPRAGPERPGPEGQERES